MAAANNYNITVTQGSELSLRFNVISGYDVNNDPVYTDISGQAVSGQVRYSYGSTGTIIDLAPSQPSPPASGAVEISLSSTQTSSLPVGSFVYDVERYTGPVYDSQGVKVAQGHFYVYPEVTR